MNFNIIRSVLLAILCQCIFSAQAQTRITPDDLKAARDLIQEFQELPFSVLACNSGDPNEARGEKAFADKNSGLVKYLNPIYQRFYSHEFYRLFMWTQCVVPKNPPLKTGGDLIEKGVFNHSYYYDFRFGTKQERGAEDGLGNIKVQSARLLTGGKIGVKVTFDYGDWNLWNNYALVFEDGAWKIDDIAPKYIRTEAETLHWGSESLKKELQIVYRYSEEQYRLAGGKAQKN